ncbi:MAG: cytidylate kinase-like family protein [Lachnospiraceae bacterium]|nr:cytidylate kinase-like family protein [Lachnospiraceae bacterium]
METRIITIGRQLGSGGREIGRKLSEDLGIPFYDQELLNEIARKSGYTKEILEKHDEKPTNSFLYALAMGGGFGMHFQKPLHLELYLAQFNTMKQLAEKGPGIFIGRCADYVFSDRKDTFNIFFMADIEFRIKRIMERDGVTSDQAAEMCIKGDKARASYYNYNADHDWGDAKYYDLCINTAKVGIDKACEMIKMAIR